MARYYRSDRNAFEPVSTEITGYAASTLVFLHGLTGDPRYLERAQTAAGFLMRAWRGAMPFELKPARFTYFFDCGIIVRGLSGRLAGHRRGEFRTWRAPRRALSEDFAAGEADFHPCWSCPQTSGAAARCRFAGRAIPGATS